MYLRFHVLLLGLAAVVCAANLAPSADAAEPAANKVRTYLKTTFDPDAERVELFAGMESGSLESWLIPENEHFGHVFIENKADKPLTVELPASVVAVNNLKQFNFGNNNNNGNNGGLFGGIGQNQGQTGGGQQNQNVGGGLQPNGGNQQNNQNGFFNNNRAGNNNFFSIPPQSRVRLDFHSVCLNYGMRTPSERHRYSLVETDKYTQDEKLKELLALVGTGKIDSDVSQAVAWHLTDGMSYEQLAGLEQYHFGGRVTALFQPQDLQQAVKLFDYVNEQLAERKKAEKNESTVADSRSLSSKN